MWNASQIIEAAENTIADLETIGYTSHRVLVKKERLYSYPEILTQNKTISCGNFDDE